MKIELMALCDYAADYSGRLSVIGVFDRIQANVFPAVHPHLCMAVKLRFEELEEGQKTVKLSVSDPDGSTVGPVIQLPLEVSMPTGIHTATRNLVLHMNGMKFERAGEYSVNLAIDGRHEASIPLFIVPMPRRTPS